ncbi:alpha/beta-hydrolase [Pluteus cervinus]|uniref:Alpha/beta-hydrolase n=1 Tax=Pluteus cervinus TaxID=181527 RepID=A0ACD3AH87_9AGAR|nr:alpha/beta-hydrolase [Pluteus cervinus]
MVWNWDTYPRQSIELVSSATSYGFAAIKNTTRLGFSITRNIATKAIGATTTAVDHTFFGGDAVTRPMFGAAVSMVLTVAEQITLAPVFLSEYITATSLVAAHSSINLLSAFFPGSSDASFSLASFITLVKREWSESADGGLSPGKQFGITHIARAVIAWVALQGVTQEWQEKQWFKYLKEINVREPSRNADTIRSRRNSRVRVTSDVIFPGNQGQIISADIGEAPPRPMSIRSTRSLKSLFMTPLTPRRPVSFLDASPPQPSNAELKITLRRLSKIVLAGYGGASLLFFGVSPLVAAGSALPTSLDKKTEESQLANAIDASEAEAAGDGPGPDEGNAQFSWWDVLLGKHDQEIFEHYANSSDHAKARTTTIKATAVAGRIPLMPRFWVLTDHGRGQIVLVLRGTMSLNEIAVDLTCEPEDFEPVATISPVEEEEEEPIPGMFTFPRPTTQIPDTASTIAPRYHVHGGMLRMARAMGDVGKPVQLAVQEALHCNPEYELILCGHSLGAGVAALLGLMWADPRTCMTVSQSGLPVGRRVSVYCFAPPCLTDAGLSRLASNLITSFVYSHDIVSRLSLGSVKDLKNAAMWLCDANERNTGDSGEGYTEVFDRARKWQRGEGSRDDPQWFVAVRKTLEANMQMTTMFPPGRVLWAIRDSDLHPAHRTHGLSSDPNKLRLFDVLDIEPAFSQIVFAKDMLSAHMPHQYDKALHDLL